MNRYAVEFESVIENNLIKIPPRRFGAHAGKVKVIILQEQPETTTNYIDERLESPLKAENFTPFSREEIYEARGHIRFLDSHIWLYALLQHQDIQKADIAKFLGCATKLR